MLLMRKVYHLLFTVLVIVDVALHAVFLNQEFHPMIERSGHTGRLLSQQNIDRIIAGQALKMICAGGMRAAFAV